MADVVVRAVALEFTVDFSLVAAGLAGCCSAESAGRAVPALDAVRVERRLSFMLCARSALRAEEVNPSDCKRASRETLDKLRAAVGLMSERSTAHVGVAQATAMKNAATRQRLRAVAGEKSGRVVGRFLRNCDVMRMTLPHTGRRDLDESCFLA